MPIIRPVPGSAPRRAARLRTLPVFPPRPTISRPTPRRQATTIYHLVMRLAVLSLWVISWTLALALPPLAATLGVVTLTGAFFWWYLRRPLRPDRIRTRATLRLRPLGRAAPRLLAIVPVWLVFNAALAAVHVEWIAVPPPEPADPLAVHAALPPGWLPLAVQGLLLAPLVEEVFFRGFIQRSLERRFGPALGIGLAALLFAAFHGEPWKFGYLLVGGIVLGTVVHAARSLWAGVILHASANASGVLLDTVQVPVTGSLAGEGGGAMLLVLAAFAALLAWMIGRLRIDAVAARSREASPVRLPRWWSAPARIG